MTRRIMVWGALAILTATLAMVMAAQRGTDLPPGVSPENWIAINHNAGIALNYERSRYFRHPLKLNIKHGTLMVRSHGSWVRVYLDPGPHEIMPIDR